MLKEIGPELKQFCLWFCLETGHSQMPRRLPKGAAQINQHWMHVIISCDNAMGKDPSNVERLRQIPGFIK